MGDLDYLVNNILSRRWKKRYEIQPDNVKKQIDELSFRDLKEFQLRVIKRKRKYPEKGDIFIVNPRENLYFKGLVVNNHVCNKNGDEQILIMISNVEYNSMDEDITNFVFDIRNLLIAPALVTTLYWTRGFFYTIGNVGNISIKETYGFYSLTDIGFCDEYGNKVKQRPDIVGGFGITTDSGIAYEINRELIIKEQGVNTVAKQWDFLSS